MKDEKALLQKNPFATVYIGLAISFGASLWLADTFEQQSQSIHLAEMAVVTTTQKQLLRIERIARQSALSAAPSTNELYSSETLEKNLEELELDHYALSNGDKDRDIPKPFNQKISNLLQNAGEDLEFIQDQANCILTKCPDSGKTAKLIQQSTNTYQEKLNDALQLARAFSKQKTDQNRLIELVKNIIVFLVVTGIFLSILYPLHRRLLSKIRKERKKNDFFKLIERIASIGGWEFDPATGQAIWTDEVYRIHRVPLGTPTKDLDLFSFYPGESRERISTFVDDCFKYGTPFDDIFEFIDQDGNHRWVRSIGKMIESEENQTPKLVGVFQDVTDRKNNERELKKTSEYFKLAVEGANLGVWDWNLITDEVSFDKRWAAIIGYDAEEIEHNYDFWISRVHPEDSPKCIEKIQDYTTGKISTYEVLHRMRHKQGHWVHILARGRFSEFDDKGSPIRFTGTHFDMTEFHLVQEEVQRQRKVAQHNAKLASIGELAAGVGHEVNNPLAIIKGQLFRLRHNPDPVIRSVVEKSNLAISRIAKIVSGLKTFARAESTTKETFLFSDAINETLEMIGEIYKKDGVAIIYQNELDARDGQCFVEGDRASLQQVLLNFLSNAKDAVSEVEKPVVQVRLYREDQEDLVTFEVNDNGAGISREQLEKIFDPFFTTKEVGKGTGIGLSISDGIVKEHHGRITVNSQPDQGTSIRASFPIANVSEGQVESLINRETDHHSGQDFVPDPKQLDAKVAIVDDELGIREVLQEVLGQYGMTTESFDNARDLLAVLKSSPSKFSAVFTDIKMPGMSGMQLFDEIKSNDELKDIKVVFMTGGINENLESRSNYYSDKIDGLLMKPFQWDKLDSVVAKLFSTSVDKAS